MPVEGKWRGQLGNRSKEGDAGGSEPDILLLILSQYLSVIINEIRYIMQLFLPRFFILISSHDCARYNAEIQRLG